MSLTSANSTCLGNVPVGAGIMLYTGSAGAGDAILGYVLPHPGAAAV